MTKRIISCSVGELSRASGVSVRTLHHYDELGLLRPAGTARNGYRVYGQAEAQRLQEILFYRSTGMSLAAIGALLDEGVPLDRLKAHRARLIATLTTTRQMIETLDQTIAALKGGSEMSIDDLYRPFDPERQATHEAWLIDTYGPEMAAQVAASKAGPAGTSEGAEAGMDALREIEAALVGQFRAGIGPDEADTEAHRDWVARMWGRPCPPDAYAGLAEIYLSHPDFIARFETLAPGFSQWLPAAMKAQSR